MRVTLTSLHLSNVALFDELQLSFDAGFTCLVGEAGSGKSLLLDALNWVLGGQGAAKDVIRTGCEQAKIELGIKLESLSADVTSWLNENGLEELATKGSVDWVLSREWSPSSSRCRLEGYLVPRPAVEELGNLLVIQQRQHSAVQLFNSAKQLATLDAYGGKRLNELKQQANQFLTIYTELKQQQANAQALERQWLKELEAAKEAREVLAEAHLEQPDEDEALRQLIQQQSHSEVLLKTIGEGLAVLKGNDWGDSAANNVQSSLQHVTRCVRTGALKDESLTTSLERLEQLEAEIAELSEQLEGYLSRIDLSPQQLEANQQRLATLEKLQRRYGRPLPELIEWEAGLLEECEKIQEQLNSLSNLDSAVEKAHSEAESALKALHKERKLQAKSLSNYVENALHDLAMTGSQFEITVEWQPVNWRQNAGADEIRFSFSANTGEPLKPLAKVASGGELARILLALQTAFATREEAESGQPVYSFDEIDTGTSGIAAKAIARQLRQLARQGCQVFTVTHQPVIAAHAHQCLWVEKQSKENKTVSQVKAMTSPEDRSSVLSLLAVGEAQTELNQALAKELLAN